MTEETLAQRVLSTLDEDREVLWAMDLNPSEEIRAQTGTETYVIGCRGSDDSALGKMLFVIALGDPAQQLNEEDTRRR